VSNFKDVLRVMVRVIIVKQSTVGSIAVNTNLVSVHVPLWFLITELYEGLKRAQRSRLEDQRGTEINFELPDFLKVRIHMKLME
jgi:hypothetical protein